MGNGSSSNHNPPWHAALGRHAKNAPIGNHIDGEHGSRGTPEIAIITITKDDPVGIKRTVVSVMQQDFLGYEQVS